MLVARCRAGDEGEKRKRQETKWQLNEGKILFSGITDKEAAIKWRQNFSSKQFFVQIIFIISGPGKRSHNHCSGRVEGLHTTLTDSASSQPFRFVSAVH
ncbi:hypothetical protein SUGI_0951070 [Cryptomeria japonica]|nr:hypothetical protein SUGI_0951070 [Cryptomeria japonica]